MLIFFLCALSAVAGGRDLTQEESDVLFKVWGVNDKEALLKLRENPRKFWDERRKELFEGRNRVITHEDFRKQYLADAKSYLAQKLEGCENPPWYKEPESIENFVKESLPESHPAFIDVCLVFYTRACDKACGLYDKTWDCCSKKNVKRLCEDLCVESNAMLASKEGARVFLSLTFGKRQEYFSVESEEDLRWRVLPGRGEFSLIDSLILRREGYHMCSVPLGFEERTNFLVHWGQYFGWYGAYQHDAFAHAWSAGYLSKALEGAGISYQEYFNTCCNPETLAAGDLVIMSLQVLAWFVQFHELPSIKEAFTVGDRFSMVFPSAPKIVDPGFMDLAPYFMMLEPGYDWDKAPLKYVRWGRLMRAQACTDLVLSAFFHHEAVHNYLLGWRSLYCFQGIKFLKQEDLGRYFSSLEEDFRYIRLSDINRSPQFLPTVLKHLYKLDRESGVIDSDQSFECFTKRSHALAERLMIQIMYSVTKRNAKSLDVRVNNAVRFLAITAYSDILRFVCARSDLRWKLIDNKFQCCVLGEEIYLRFSDVTQREAEDLLKKHAEECGLPLLIAEISACYGPGGSS